MNIKVRNEQTREVSKIVKYGTIKVRVKEENLINILLFALGKQSTHTVS